MEHKTHRAGSYALILIAATCWGVTGSFNRVMDSMGFAQESLLLIRPFFALIFMAVYLLIFHRDAFCIKLKDIWVFLCAGIASLALFQFAYFSAMQYMSLATAATLLYLAPMIVVFLSALFFKEKITIAKIIALILTLVGAVCVTGLIKGAVTISLAGLGLGLLSAVGYALYSIFSRVAFQKGYSPNTVTFYTFAFCTLAMLFVVDVPMTFEMVTSSSEAILWSIGLGVVTALFPYLLYTKGLEHVENGHASVIATWELVVATLMSVLVFQEAFDWTSLLGVALVIAGIVLVSVYRAKPKVGSAPKVQASAQGAQSPQSKGE